MKRTYLYLLIGGFLMLASLVGQSAGMASEFPRIRAEQLKSKMDAGEPLMLINPLSEIEYNAQHIPGSVHIPLQEMLVTDKLPADKDQLIITYCLGPK